MPEQVDIFALLIDQIRAVVREEIKAALSGNGHSSNGSEAEKLLDANEAAAMLGHSEVWLYRNSKRLPFSVRMGRSVRFSRKGIEKWIEAQKRS